MRNTCGNSNRERAMKLVEDGLVNAYTMLVSCLMCMSESEVGDMLHYEEYDDDNDDDNDDNDDNDDADDADDDDDDGVEK